MKKSELRQLIKEEIRNSLKETSPVDRHKAFNKIVDMMVNKGFAQDEAEVLLNSLLKAFKGDELKDAVNGKSKGGKVVFASVKIK